MNKTYKPSEINILQRQVVPTDKINISEAELIEELRNRIQCDPFDFFITRLHNPLGDVSFSIHNIKPDEELFVEQYREADKEASANRKLTLDEEKKMLLEALLSEQLNDPYIKKPKIISPEEHNSLMLSIRTQLQRIKQPWMEWRDKFKS